VEEQQQDLINSHLAEPEDDSDEVELGSLDKSEEENKQDTKPKVKKNRTPVKKKFLP